MASSPALPLETARPADFLGFDHDHEAVHQPTKFQHSRAMHGRVTVTVAHFFQGDGRLHPDESESCMVRAKCGRAMVQSSALNKFVLDFRCVAPFQNEGD